MKIRRNTEFSDNESSPMDSSATSSTSSTSGNSSHLSNAAVDRNAAVNQPTNTSVLSADSTSTSDYPSSSHESSFFSSPSASSDDRGRRRERGSATDRGRRGRDSSLPASRRGRRGRPGASSRSANDSASCSSRSSTDVSDLSVFLPPLALPKKARRASNTSKTTRYPSHDSVPAKPSSSLPASPGGRSPIPVTYSGGAAVAVAPPIFYDAAFLARITKKSAAKRAAEADHNTPHCRATGAQRERTSLADLVTQTDYQYMPPSFSAVNNEASLPRTFSTAVPNAPVNHFPNPEAPMNGAPSHETGSTPMSNESHFSSLRWQQDVWANQNFPGNRESIAESNASPAEQHSFPSAASSCPPVPYRFQGLSNGYHSFASAQHGLSNAQYCFPNTHYGLSSAQHGLPNRYIPHSTEHGLHNRCEFHNAQHGLTSIHHGSFNAQHGLVNAQHGLSNAQHCFVNAQHGLDNAQHGFTSVHHGPSNAQHGFSNAQHGLVNAHHDLTSVHHGLSNAQHGFSNAHHGPSNTQHGLVNAQHDLTYVHHGVSNAQHGSVNAQHGSVNAQHGSANAQHGSANAQCGSVSAQHGSVNAQRGFSSAQHGFSNAQHGLVGAQHSLADAPLDTTYAQRDSTCTQHDTGHTQHSSANACDLSNNDNGLSDTQQNLDNVPGGILNAQQCIPNRGYTFPSIQIGFPNMTCGAIDDLIDSNFLRYLSCSDSWQRLINCAFRDAEAFQNQQSRDLGASHQGDVQPIHHQHSNLHSTSRTNGFLSSHDVECQSSSASPQPQQNISFTSSGHSDFVPHDDTVSDSSTDGSFHLQQAPVEPSLSNMRPQSTTQSGTLHNQTDRYAAAKRKLIRLLQIPTPTHYVPSFEIPCDLIGSAQSAQFKQPARRQFRSCWEYIGSSNRVQTNAPGCRTSETEHSGDTKPLEDQASDLNDSCIAQPDVFINSQDCSTSSSTSANSKKSKSGVKRTRATDSISSESSICSDALVGPRSSTPLYDADDPGLPVASPIKYTDDLDPLPGELLLSIKLLMCCSCKDMRGDSEDSGTETPPSVRERAEAWQEIRRLGDKVLADLTRGYGTSSDANSDDSLFKIPKPLNEKGSNSKTKIGKGNSRDGGKGKGKSSNKAANGAAGSATTSNCNTSSSSSDGDAFLGTRDLSSTLRSYLQTNRQDHEILYDRGLLEIIISQDPIRYRAIRQFIDILDGGAQGPVAQAGRADGSGAAGSSADRTAAASGSNADGVVAASPGSNAEGSVPPSMTQRDRDEVNPNADARYGQGARPKIFSRDNQNTSDSSSSSSSSSSTNTSTTSGSSITIGGKCKRAHVNISELPDQERQGSHKCLGCKKPVQDRYVLHVRDHGYWHADCLRCCTCDSNLSSQPTCYVRDERVFCRSDYNVLFGLACVKCSLHFKKDEDWMRVAGQHRYHIACFLCKICKRQLGSNERYHLVNGTDIYCTNHYRDLVNGDNADGQHPPKKAKRNRTSYTESQIKYLQDRFNIDSNPDGNELEKIASRIGLKKRVVQVWFQNNRARLKKTANNSKGSNQENKNPSANNGLTGACNMPDDTSFEWDHSMEPSMDSQGYMSPPSPPLQMLLPPVASAAHFPTSYNMTNTLGGSGPISGQVASNSSAQGLMQGQITNDDNIACPSRHDQVSPSDNDPSPNGYRSNNGGSPDYVNGGAGVMNSAVHHSEMAAGREQVSPHEHFLSRRNEARDMSGQQNAGAMMYSEQFFGDSSSNGAGNMDAHHHHIHPHQRFLHAYNSNLGHTNSSDSHHIDSVGIYGSNNYMASGYTPYNNSHAFAPFPSVVQDSPAIHNGASFSGEASTNGSSTGQYHSDNHSNPSASNASSHNGVSNVADMSVHNAGRQNYTNRISPNLGQFPSQSHAYHSMNLYTFTPVRGFLGEEDESP